MTVLNPESTVGRLIRALLRQRGPFTADQLHVTAGRPTMAGSPAAFSQLENDQFIRPGHTIAQSYQVYSATPKGLAWARVLEDLVATPQGFVKSPDHPCGRLLLAAFQRTQGQFTAEDLELALGLAAGSLREPLRTGVVFFAPASTSAAAPTYLLTNKGLRNAAVLDRAWREMRTMLTFPHAVHDTTPAVAMSAASLKPPQPLPESTPSASGSNEPLIKARGLARQFRKRGRNGTTMQAVRGVDITVRRGELVGFLGPNGAGKTTTLRMLTTLLRPTAGKAVVAGCDLLNNPRGVRRRIGYVAQGSGCSPESTVEEELRIQGRLHGLSKSNAIERGAELVGQLDLLGLERRQTRTLSGGQRRRLDIALGLVQMPELVFLDEPTTGLDPQSRAHLWERIRRLRAEQGVTAFLTTHYLDEADALCDRILIMDNGRIIAEGTPDTLKARVSGDVLELRSTHIAAAAEIAGRLEGARDVSAADGLVRLRVPRGDIALPVLLRALDTAQIAATSIQVNRPSLDDVFLALTGRSLREGQRTGTPRVSAGGPRQCETSG
ncbi:ATP-binding cassette domain-containing protein [Streptomyces sp. NPDC050625]|uniref:ATP-binding cassette domain-containing protein n=1 Tax=Streptomyces sp. NPDC050625 TaxID=3154629 RepID=UPI00342606C8